MSGHSFDSKRAAFEDYRVQLRAAKKRIAEAGKKAPPSPACRLPLTDYCQLVLKGPYLDRIARGDLVQETWDMYDGVVSNHLDGTPLGEMAIEDVEHEDVSEWADRLTVGGRVKASGEVISPPRPASDSTKIRYLGFLSGVYEIARKDKLVMTNPVRDAEKPTVDLDEIEFRIYSLEECDRILVHLRAWEAHRDLIPPKIPGKERKKQPRPAHERNRTVTAALLGLHGFGPGELLGMSTEDLKDGGLLPRRQGRKGKIVLRLKNRHRKKWVPIDDELLKIVEESPPGLIISANAERTKAMDDANLRRAYRYALAGTEFAGMLPYDLRHTFAMRLLEEGVDVQTAAELMRNSTETFLRRYVRSREALKREAVRKARGGRPTQGTNPNSENAA